MDLAIVFITHNRKSELIRAINSCVTNGGSFLKYIIVDNNSDDGTREAVFLQFPSLNIVYDFQPSNLGVAGGRNRAFSYVSERYAFFLDDDAIVVGDNFFERIVDFMDSNINVVAASPNILEPITRTNLNSKHFYYDGKNKEILSFCGCAHILRTDFFKQIGSLYPDNLKFGSEELYSSFRARMEDKSIVEITDLLVEHYPSTINRVCGNDRKFNFIFNQYLIKKYTYPKNKLFITNIIFTLHKIKNGLIGKQWKALEKKYSEERFQKEFVYRMNLKCYKKLLKHFGWKAVL